MAAVNVAIPNNSDAETGRPGKRQRVGESEKSPPPPLDFAYDPEELCDVVIVTGDGKRIGAHRAYLLRHSKLVKGIIAEFGSEEELVVTETFANFRKLFLDLIYDRSLSITADIAIQVLNLADKYEATALVNTCKTTLLSDDFKLHLSRLQYDPDELAIQVFLEVLANNPNLPRQVVHTGEGHCCLTEALLIASKYKWTELFEKCIEWLQVELADINTLNLFRAATLPHLGQLTTAEALQLTKTACSALSSSIGRAHTASKMVMNAEEAKEKEKRKKEKIDKQYKTLLQKYNRLHEAAKAAGVVVQQQPAAAHPPANPFVLG